MTDFKFSSGYECGLFRYNEAVIEGHEINTNVYYKYDVITQKNIQIRIFLVYIKNMG